jgi:hypothetical protein
MWISARFMVINVGDEASNGACICEWLEGTPMFAGVHDKRRARVYLCFCLWILD